VRQQQTPLPQRPICASLKGGCETQAWIEHSNYVGADSRTKLKLSRMWALKNSPLLKLLFIAVYVSAGTF
jgi:hypothetical protein